MVLKFENTKSAIKNLIIIGGILIFALVLRLVGIDWDSGQHLHPDERFLTMVTTAIKFPQNFMSFFDSRLSTANPYNVGFNFYVYGTLPVYLTKYLSQLLNMDNYAHTYLVGRVLSAIADVGVIVLLFKISNLVFNRYIGYLSAFFYSISVLPIQLSHFYTTDTYLNFFIFLTFYLLLQIIKGKHNYIKYTFLGCAYGLALASKISAVYFSLIIFIGFIWIVISRYKKNRIVGLVNIISGGFVFSLVAFMVLRVAQPGIFMDGDILNWKLNPHFISNLKQLESFNDSSGWFPPALQWRNTTAVLFPLKNIILWGLGLPLSIIVGLGFIWNIFDAVKQGLSKKIYVLLILVWIVFVLIFQGSQYVKTMRYFIVIYPFLTLLAALFIYEIQKKIKPNNYLKVLSFLILLIYPLSFISIYFHKHTRVEASEWIYKNIPPGSTITSEHWDDPLPLYLPGKDPGTYKGVNLPLFDPDTDNKWQKINMELEKVNYIILSSNRLYGTIPNNPGLYPVSSHYYQSLFNGSLGFKLEAQFTSYPCLPPYGRSFLCFNDDLAEEAFTVYDHPKVLVFKKVE